MTPIHARLFLAFGALSAAAAVILGAVAAHLPDVAPAAQPMFQTALQLHMFHALGLLATGLAAARLPASRWVMAAGGLMMLGTLLFSGNLYLRSMAGIDAFRFVTPWGGGAWILAWLALAIGIMKAGKSETTADAAVPERSEAGR